MWVIKGTSLVKKCLIQRVKAIKIKLQLQDFASFFSFLKCPVDFERWVRDMKDDLLGSTIARMIRLDCIN